MDRECQLLWDAWTPAKPWATTQALPYFVEVARDQLDEIEGAEELSSVVHEWIDLIAVAINALRFYHGMTPGKIEAALELRIRTRYQGQTDQIRRKYAAHGGDVADERGDAGGDVAVGEEG